MLPSSQIMAPGAFNINSTHLKKIQNYLFDTQVILGKGSFSTVHPGLHSLTNEPIAVKVVRLDSLTSKKRADLLEDEISILCSMSHPSIIRCLEVLKSTNNCYIITELCEQGNLEGFLRQRKSISEEEIWPYIRDIHQGLKYLSSQCIIHRDLKTANIFLKEGKVKIADFGFAAHARFLFHDISIGSPIYMSPQGYIDHIYGPKTDIWAFGVIIYELLHGRAPCSSCTNQNDLKNKMRQRITEEDLKPNLSPELKQLLFRCLEVNQSARITVQEIEHLPFFKKYQRTALSVSQTNIGVSRCQSTPIIMRNCHQEEHFLPSKNVIRHEPSKLIQFNNAQEPQNATNSTPKRRYLKKQSRDETISSADSSNEQNFRESHLLKGNITFNQTLGLIHFCRVGYSLLKESLEDCLKGTIKNAIVKILQDILSKVDSKMVSFEVKQSKTQKQKKLKMVVGQYLQKYRVFPLQGKHLLDINCEKSKNLLKEFLLSLENKLNKTQEEVYSMHLMLIFLIFCDILNRGAIIQDYSCFASDNIIENCLSNKGQFSSIQHFYKLKMKYSFAKGVN